MLKFQAVDNLQDLELILEQILPLSSLEEDNNGQIVIYTGVKEGFTGNLKSL